MCFPNLLCTIPLTLRWHHLFSWYESSSSCFLLILGLLLFFIFIFYYFLFVAKHRSIEVSLLLRDTAMLKHVYIFFDEYHVETYGVQ
jgi:hypothetical protein